MGHKEIIGENQRSLILKVAGKLFLEYGYKETSIRQIARELNISPGLIGYYFPSKRDIAIELFSRKLKAFMELEKQYVSEDDPVLRSAVLIRLQITVLSSPMFRKFYMDALREDIILSVIRASGDTIYRAVGEKYGCKCDDSFFVTSDLLAASMERTLMLYSDEVWQGCSVADEVFKVSTGRIYGTEEFLRSKCEESELITARILCEHPELLRGWSETEA